MLPDFQLKRHDTQPRFEIVVADCGNPIDLTNTVLEVSIWSVAKLKTAVAPTDTVIAFADGVGFQQVAQGDIIVVDRVRSPEQMLVIGFDEANKLIEVSRGYAGTAAGTYKKGTRLRNFRSLNSVGTTEMTLQNVTQVDGTVQNNVITESRLIYDWIATDTCLPGCFYMELKLLKMTSASLPFSGPFFLTPSVTPSFVSYTSSQLSCNLGAGVQWVRRFPSDREGFLIQIIDTPTSESLV